MDASDVLILGGGIIGLAAARELARTGRTVTLVTRDAPGAGASSTAAGMLELHYPFPVPPAIAALGAYSRPLYGPLAAALAAETGIDVGLDTTGTLVLAADAAEAGELRVQAAAVSGSRLLESPAAWRALEPALPADLAAALLLPDDHHVHPGRLCAALELASERLGVAIRRGVTARRYLVEAGRVVGAETDAGPLRAAWTINAAGAWAGGVEGAPPAPPVRPVKGQLLWLALPVLPAHVLQRQRVYLVPRPADGLAVLGATVEEAGFDEAPTPGALARLVAEGTRLFRPVGESRLLAVRTGLRPGSPDELPILGPGPLPGLLLAGGFYRKGILMAPAAARILADLVAGTAPAVPLAPYAPGRF